MQVGRLGGLRISTRPLAQRQVASRPSRCGLRVQAVGDYFDKLKGGKGKGAGSEEAARKALQDTFGGGNQKKYEGFFGQQGGQPGGGGAGGGFGASGRGGGSGGFSGLAPGGAGGADPGDRPIWVEVLEAARYAWVVFWNLALFLAFASVMHRSLDWCVSVELLLLVGAGRQAFERVAGVFFTAVEWVEKNVLGWDIPGETDMIPQYMNIKMFYPEQHAYTFDQYRYDLTDREKTILKNTYALRHYERIGGYPGDVTPEEVAAVKTRHDPLETDRQLYQIARAEGWLEEYWAARTRLYEYVVGQPFVRPPGVAPPAAA
ncbi:hypothetical protein V8C86DRAFT_3127697 [Haematococcus lacustris]